VQTDDFRASPFLEMALNCSADILSQLRYSLSFGENRVPKSAGRKPSFRGFLNQEDDFIHVGASGFLLARHDRVILVNDFSNWQFFSQDLSARLPSRQKHAQAPLRRLQALGVFARR
jgi:hypothetical protein